ncbi:hypothetical protein [Streptomyces sp. H27-S2]|uniref:hypothetical protein n=1 Tax=Streptomyces antarcticus TaxID=2996458 RepID=UPI002270C2A6|nr:hypothetical protein [Streptomyces sp. H27-S2]MCY0948617.1 hypothetical protein [Streptomyces sp. H27-S2]
MSTVPEWGPKERAFLNEGLTRILARRFGPALELSQTAGARADDELIAAVIQALPGLLTAVVASLDPSAEALTNDQAQCARGAGSAAVHREP